MRGSDLCRSVRASPRWRELPVVLLRTPGKRAPAERVDAIEAGADDVLADVGDAEALVARVRQLVVRARIHRERADTDALTGLLLRRPYLERLAALLAAARRQRAPLTVCLIDLDKFKQVNDEVGHLSGDRLLAAFGRVLLGTCRLEDLRCRWGGDEFALAFPGQSADAAQLALTRVEQAAAEIRVAANVSPGVKFSAGTATFPDDGLDAAELLRVADQRLYRAKALGRGRAVTT
jgi:diguanylate cyclase (GGDEF)-like protein